MIATGAIEFVACRIDRKDLAFVAMLAQVFVDARVVFAGRVARPYEGDRARAEKGVGEGRFCHVGPCCGFGISEAKGI